jgi:trk system potassium uptake protein TrkH
VVFEILARLVGYRKQRMLHGESRPVRSRFSLQTRVVLIVSGALLILGALFFLLAEWSNPTTLGTRPIGQKVLGALFQSVTTRTAGFSTIAQGELTPESKLGTVMLMLIGASPGSTGGGIKTVTAFVVLALIWSTLRGRERTELFGRSLPRDVSDRALVVIVAFILVVLLATMVLVVFDWRTAERTQAEPFLSLLFEVASALGTVGLSTGITPDLHWASKLCLIIVMFIGRMGPLTLVVAMGERRRAQTFDYPEERVMIG